MNNSESKISPDCVPSKFPFWGMLLGGEGDYYLLDMDLFTGERRYQSFDYLGVPYIDMV